MSDDFSSDSDPTGGTDVPPDAGSYQEITSRSWFGRMAGSFIAALVGLLLFLASFALLYWNEGRAVDAITGLDAGARAVVSVAVDRLDPAMDGRLVHVTGTPAITGPAVDPVFKVGGGDAMRLRRTVEMYQWQEHEHTRTEKHIGGGETRTTTYTYQKEWSEQPIDSARFKQPAAHANPAMPGRSAVFDAATISLGAFRLDNSLISQMDAFKPVVPGAADGIRSFRLVGDRLYRGGSPDAPAVGDVRIAFGVVAVQPVSVVAGQIGSTLAPFSGRNGYIIDRLDLGTRGAAQMFHEAQAEEAMLTWILRGVGFLMMLFGLLMMSAPLSWLVSVLPFLDTLVGIAAFFVALVLAIPLTLITIAIAWLAHRPLLGIGLVAAGILVAAGLRRIAPRRRSPMRA